jgi:hypothetical protein
MSGTAPQARTIVLSSLLLMSLMILRPHGAAAEGALAIGITGDVAKDGYSIGINVNSKTAQEARDSALNWCKTHGAKQTEDKCQIVTTFRNQCVAEAQDPKPGTPGAGWALAPDKDTAEKLAMTTCLATAGKTRLDACKVVSSICDTGP